MFFISYLCMQPYVYTLKIAADIFAIGPLFYSATGPKFSLVESGTLCLELAEVC